MSDPLIGGRPIRLDAHDKVTGRAAYPADLRPDGVLYGRVLRSPHPHARIVGVDTRRAEAHPGVFAVLTGADLERWCNPMATAPEGWGPYTLAVGKVRFVGEPVAAVAASSRYVAEDACELIDVEYELLPVVADPCVATDPETILLFEERGTNLMLDRAFTWGDIDGVFAAAAHVFSAKFRWNRVGANPTETFGCVCQWDLTDNSLLCHGSYQVPSFWGLARSFSLNLPANKVKVVSHPHGGAFGGKGGARATDIAALLSRKTGGLPVKYIEDRMEYLLAGGGQSWDRYYDAAVAVNADGTVTGLRVRLLDNAWRIREAVTEMDFQTTHFRTPIVPIIMDAPDKAQGLSRFLEENGVIAPFMNYPVRKAMHQIRIAVSASHTDDQISQLLGLLKQWKDTHESN